MKKRHLVLLLFALRAFPAFSGEITVNCDSRVINEKACVALFQDSLKTVGCQASEPHCLLHPWGSDFIKSWICSIQSNDCSTATKNTCPAGSTHVFDEALSVCVQSKIPPSSFHGVCRHEHAAHSITVKNCEDAPATCAKFGGTPLKCSAAEGFSDQFEVSCGFPSLQTPETGTSCSELQSRCDLINTDKGVKGSLLSCLPQTRKSSSKSTHQGPFDSN
jgi:hypothetical protein